MASTYLVLWSPYRYYCTYPDHGDVVYSRNQKVRT